MHIRRLSIVGIGLLGGSLGLAARKSGSVGRIIGYGRDAQVRRRAAEMGAVDEASGDLAAAVGNADLVVLCTPVGCFADVLGKIGPHLSPGAVVSDVGSTKTSVVADAARLLPAHVHFVGSHPMAGSEKRGVEFARADLFQNALCILTPTPNTDAFALQRVETFWRQLGMRTVQLTPPQHDQWVAQISHVPHAVAAAVAACASDAALPLAGRGFFDATRIAAGDAGLWRDILLDNAPAVRAGLERVRQSLADLDRHLEHGDTEAVRDWLATAATRLADEQRRRGG